ncbi:MAG: hypothetical protein LUQ69_01505 [Methanoregulaceae archaeon]|nr:hypothetical protein [Methanoregulaceae archaeon]
MQLDELRVILLSERETGRLVSIPADIFDSARAVIGELTAEVYAQEDPFHDDARYLIERVAAIRETLEDLFRIRTQKILALAYTQEQGQYIDRDEMKKMIPAERKMFDEISLAIAGCRCLLTGGGTGPVPGQVEAAEGAMLPEQAPRVPPYVLVRAVETMEPFMGVDGRIYALEKEDIVTLPERNAAVLCERNIVLNMNLGK